MNKSVLVIGHRNPDTDSICAAIGYAFMKQQLGVEAKAARAGKLNPETRFVLDYFKVPDPVLVHDLYPALSDVALLQPPTLNPEDTLRTLSKLFVEHPHLKSLPVLDEARHIAGVVTGSDVARRYYNELAQQEPETEDMDFRCILDTLEGRLLCGDVNKHFHGRFYIAALQLDRMHQVIKPGNLLIVGDREEAQLAGLEAGMVGLVVTYGSPVSEKVLTLARAKGAVIISTNYDTYFTARLINQSVPVRLLMTPQVECFKITDMLTDVKEKMLSTQFAAYPVCEQGKYLGMVDRGVMLEPSRQEVILVDHNERSQAVEGVDEARILEIIDHHRLGGLTTGAPIFIRQEPVGSTSTIVANLIWHRAIKMTPQIAGVLFAAIVSDTLYFRSPTTTKVDMDTAIKLEELAGIKNPDDLAMEILRHGSSLETMSMTDLVRNDIKEFELEGSKISVSQLNILDRAKAMELLPQIMEALEALRKQEGYNLSLLMLTDILSTATDLAAAGPSQAALRSAFGQPQQPGLYYLPGVMSRKRQIIPPLTEALKNL